MTQTRHILTALAATLALVLCSAPAHALYRGDEMEPRDYNIGHNFFINRTLMRQLPQNIARFDAATNAFIGSAGSLGSTDLYLYQHLKVRHALSEQYTFRADYLRDRDFDAIFHRFEMGLIYNLSPEWSVELLGEPLAEKEFADIGGAIEYTGDRLRLRLQWLFPAFTYDDKNSDDGKMERSAPNAQVDALYRAGKRWEFRFHSDLDPARRLVNQADSYQFRFEKYVMGVEARRYFSEESYVRASVEGEQARKQRDGLEPEDPSEFRVDRKYYMATLEYLRRLEEYTHLRAGGVYIRFDEDNEFPNNTKESILLDRHESHLYAGRNWPLRAGLHLNTYFITGLLRNRRIREDSEESAYRERFLARAAGSLMFLGPQHNIEVGGAINMDSTRFGGGFVRVFVDF